MDDVREPPLQRRGPRGPGGVGTSADRPVRRDGAARGRGETRGPTGRGAVRRGERSRGVPGDGKARATRSSRGLLAAAGGRVAGGTARPARGAAGLCYGRATVRGGRRGVRRASQDDAERLAPHGIRGAARRRGVGIVRRRSESSRGIAWAARVREHRGGAGGVSASLIVREAHAKVNACLRVLGVRDDGYHDLESLVIPVDLHDTVTVRLAEGLKVDVHGASALVDAVDAGGMNLALVAALALAQTCGGASRGAEGEIAKRLPVARGLG